MRSRSQATLIVSAMFVLSAQASAQVTRWNSNARLDDVLDDAPAVQVWIDGFSAIPSGGAARVGFRVDEDAHVVVGRVDWNGRLTILFPATRTRSTFVRGGVDRRISGDRLGGIGTFIANEAPGMTGFVFAIASYLPFDLDNVSASSFSRYATGYTFASGRRYVGDPDRVIDRISRAILYDEGAPFDYDIAYYSVDQPTYASTAGFLAYCRSALRTSWYYGAGYDDGSACSSLYGWYNSCAIYSFAWMYGSPYGCYGRYRPQVVTQGPVPPRLPGDSLGTDSSRVNPWAPDSIPVPNVDRQPAGKDRDEVPRRPLPVPVGGDEDDRSFSIPERALPKLGKDGLVRGSDAREPGTGTMANQPRRSPEVAGSGSSDWVRPPRDIERAGADDRSPPRGPRRETGSRGGDAPRDYVNTREREPRSYNPPPPRRAADRSSRGGGTTGSGGGGYTNDRGGTSSAAPPRQIESTGSRGGGGQASPPPAKTPETGTGSERKPDERKPEARQP
ncbi:MAG: hypothetical protein ACT4OZ_16585 [Gemmatimonadota bacterium]